MASHHSVSNGIYGLMINDQWIQDQREIRNEVENFYMDLYKDDHCSRSLVDGMEFEHISSSNNSLLEGRFSEDEI